MFHFTYPEISMATATDIPVIRDLLNSAYRGEASKKGWTSEAHLIAGEVRATEDTIQAVMDRSGSVFLKYTDPVQGVIGCVNLQQDDRGVYLGMFAVSPVLQGGGVGGKLLQSAEEYTRQVQTGVIYMRVITLRAELIDWYLRHGYRDTGERTPFVETAASGKHLQPLEFMILEKML